MRLIEAQRVSKTFGAVRALRGVTLTIDAGERVVLHGANGSGKSTLLALLGGAMRPTSGVIRYPGLGGSREAARGRIGWLGHEVHAYGELTVAENLAFFAEIHRQSAVSVRGLVERLLLQEVLERPVRGCSRGQRQRVSLALSLLGSPAVLLLDEPTTGLDASAVQRLLAVLREESERGVAQVLVTHDPTFAAQFPGSRAVHLERGGVVTS